MGASVGGSKGPQADINVTPLVDIVLVLLIIFMVITPMITSDVKLPEAQNAESKNDKEEPTIISVQKDGTLYLNDEQSPVTEQHLEATLAFELASEPWKPILIKGDVKARYADVRRVMEICEDLGAKSVGLQTNEKKSYVTDPDESCEG